MVGKMKTIRLAILFSGNGSNLENIYRRMQGFVIGDSSLRGESIKLDFTLAVSSNESAFGIQRCANLGLKCEVVDYKQNKADFIPKIIALLENNQIDLVILAGFMKILPPAFNAKFRAINIHPSILPLFKGAHAIEQSYQSDMKIAGVSVHFVSDELDSGALIMQDIIHKIDGESLENFEARIHELEYEIYPKAIIKAIKMLCNSSLELHSADFGIFGASQTPSLVSAPKIPKNYESQTENPSVVDSLHESKDKKTPSLQGESKDSPKQSKNQNSDS